MKQDDYGTIDTQFERQVEIIRNLVDSYMKIIYKTTRDFLPKIIMHLVVNSIRDFFKNELLAHIYSLEDLSGLMDEAPEEMQKREENLRIYNSTKEALKIISEVARGDTPAFTKAPQSNNVKNVNSYRLAPTPFTAANNRYNAFNELAATTSSSYTDDLLSLDFSRLNAPFKQTPPMIPKRPSSTVSFMNNS